MTGFTLQAQEFDDWISCNFNELLKYGKRYEIENDLIIETYLNVKNRILISGYTGNQYMTFFKRSLRNLHINEKKKQNGKFYIEIDNEDYETTIENKLQEQDDTDRDTQLYREDVIFLSKMIFKFIENRNYNEEMQFVFRCYYLMPNRMTYSKLHLMTGVDKVKCCRIIKTIKKDIRNGFLDWLKIEQKNGRNLV